MLQYRELAAVLSPLLFILNFFRNNFLFILIAFILGLLYAVKTVHGPVDFKIALTVETDQQKELTQFYCHTNNTYKGESVAENSYTTENQIAKHTYELVNDITCGESATHLRFDPLSAGGQVNILSMRIHTQYWQQVNLTQAIKHIRALHNIESIQLKDDKISITANGEDPYIELANNLQSYLTPTQKDMLLLVLKYSLWALFWVKLFTWVSGLILKNGLSIYTTANTAKKSFDFYLHKITHRLWLVTSNPTSVSFVLLCLGLAMFLFSSYVFASHISQQFNLGSTFVVLFSVLQFVFIFSGYLLLISLLGHIKWLRIMIGFLFLISMLYIAADVSLFSINGMHINHGIGLLTDGGIGQFLNNLKFTQLSETELTIYLVVLITCFLIGLVAVWFAEFKLKRSHFKISINHALSLSLVSLLLIYFTQNISAKHLNQKQIITYEQHHPTGLSFFDVEDFIISFEAKAKPFHRSDTAPVLNQQAENSPVQNIYLFILESIREDVVNTEVTPNLVEFKQQSWQFEQAIASGNATHYGWFSIINAREPFFWERYRDLHDKQGSIPLQLFKQLGYKINVYSGKDLSYLKADQTMFGQDLSLLDYISPHPDMSPPEHDQRAIEELLKDIETKHQQSKNLNVIFLDSSHYPYRWHAGDFEEITPYEGTAAEGTDLSTAKNMVKNDKTTIFNRYKNSIKYMDHLFGKMIHALNEHDLTQRSMIVAVGDHGQQFMEHGYMMHGFTLYNEDINVPLYFQGANIVASKESKVASHVDIMPTILDHIGVDTESIQELGGQTLFADDNSYKLSAVAGQQNTPATFVIASTQWKMYFHTDINSSSVFNKIYITEITDQQDVSYMPGNGLQSDYLNFINQEFPDFLQQIKIFN